LAERQGLLYGHQLPPLINGPPREEVRRFLAQLLNGKAQELAPVRVGPLDHPLLSAAQREAVARALATPDLCLIQGLPVSGKSRVAAEITARAAARGDRVLLVAPHPASVDRVLELLDGNDAVYAIRCLGRDESIAALPAISRARVYSEQVRSLHAQAVQTAERQAADGQQRCQDMSADAALWPHLLELAERQEQLAEQSAALTRRRDGIPDAVAATVSRLLVSIEGARAGAEAPSADHHLEAALVANMRAFEEARARLDTALTDVASQIQTGKNHLLRLNAEQDALAPLAEARAGRRWWTPRWWRAFFMGDVAAKAADLQARVGMAQVELTGLEDESARLTAERRQAEEKERAERAAITGTEIARRRNDLGAEEAALQEERTLVENKWHATLSRLHGDTLRPEAATVAAVREARAGWQRDLEAAAKRCNFAAEWVAQLRLGADGIAAQIPACTNLVASPLAALGTDEQFGDMAAQAAATFDLLLVEHAEQLSEAEFVAVARRCRRWVLIAEAIKPEPAVEESPASPPGTSSARVKPPRHKNRPAAPRFFQRLWSHLHCDPRRLPYRWQREADNRLCCRLRLVPAEQRRWIETERVADFPDIELRIMTPPRPAKGPAPEPYLTEVVFPPAMSVLDAKRYVFRELEEVPVRAGARSLEWQEGPECLVLRLTADGGSTEPSFIVPLACGVRELVAHSANGQHHDPDGWWTTAVEFDRAAGWGRLRAEEWAARHLGLRDLGRTAVLHDPQGMAPGLAALLADVLFAGSCRVDERIAAIPPTVEFVAVPPLPRLHGRGERRRTRLPAGAGLEVDLTDPRHRDRLPSDLRGRLREPRGLVNYMEAQAVVRTLARLAREHGAARGDGRPPHGDFLTRNGSLVDPLSVAVIALYPAQAELIRLLLADEAESLASAGVDVRVDVPAAFYERNCALALVCLTRSHTHRATSFGAGPAGLVTALTRGRDRLIVFGDAGTLARRAEWQAPLDHLDEAASAHERTIVARMVHYLMGDGAHPHLFHVRHDSPTPTGGRGVPVRGAAAREGSNA
jgi:hypothetical protein